MKFDDITVTSQPNRPKTPAVEITDIKQTIKGRIIHRICLKMYHKINIKIKNSIQLKENQINNIDNTLKNIPDLCKKNHKKIEDIFSDDTIANSNKPKAILWETMNDNISLDDIEKYLRASDLKTTDDKRLLCAYDMKRYK